MLVQNRESCAETARLLINVVAETQLCQLFGGRDFGGFFRRLFARLGCFLVGLSAVSAAFFLRPFGASDGSPAFLRPAARRGCEPSCSARASSSTTASVSVIVSGVLSPVMVALTPLWLT